MKEMSRDELVELISRSDPELAWKLPSGEKSTAQQLWEQGYWEGHELGLAEVLRARVLQRLRETDQLTLERTQTLDAADSKQLQTWLDAVLNGGDVAASIDDTKEA